MTETASHMPVNAVAESLIANPFLVDVPGVLELTVEDRPVRSRLHIDELLETEALDRIGVTEYGPHQPFLAGMEALHDAKIVQQAVDEILFDGCAPETAEIIDERFVALRDSLGDLSDAFEEGSPFHELNDMLLIEKLAGHQEKFLRQAERRQPELERAREAFVERVRYAIDYQGFPLSHEQFDARMEGVRLGFRHPLNDRSEAVASYDSLERHALININRPTEEILSDVFHELLHAISGVVLSTETGEVRKLGLQYNAGKDQATGKLAEVKRLWLNEAVTDLLTNILLDRDGQEWDFGSDATSIYFARNDDYELLAYQPMIRAERSGYHEHKFAMLDATKAIPTRVLLEAYLFQDDDPYVKDQRAGTHAERELQRAMKQTGGTERVLQYRQIDHQFRKGRNILTGPNAIRHARGIAGQIAQDGTVQSTTPVARRLYARDAEEQTRQRHGQIERAKMWVSSREEGQSSGDK